MVNGSSSPKHKNTSPNTGGISKICLLYDLRIEEEEEAFKWVVEI